MFVATLLLIFAGTSDEPSGRAMESAHSKRVLQLENELVQRTAADPSNIDLLNQLAHFRFRVGRVSHVLETLDRVEQLDPNAAYPQLLRGAIAEENLDFSSAIRAYRVAIERDPRGELGNSQLVALETWIQTLERAESKREVLDRKLWLIGVLWTLLALFAYRSANPRVDSLAR